MIVVADCIVGCACERTRATSAVLESHTKRHGASNWARAQQERSRFTPFLLYGPVTQASSGETAPSRNRNPAEGILSLALPCHGPMASIGDGERGESDLTGDTCRKSEASIFAGGVDGNIRDVGVDIDF